MNITATNTQNPNVTPLHHEWDMFCALSLRLVNDILNRVFGLTINGSRQRQTMLAMLFLLVGVVLYLSTHSLSEWRNYLQIIFSTLFTNQPTIEEAFTLLNGVLFNARILRLLPVFILPFILSQEFASRYLADVFNLKNIRIARKFVSEVSLGGADNTLTVNAANLDQEEISPLLQIGGPGRVTVELGTAILVEKPDGRPRIIGPTHNSDDEEDKPIIDQFGNRRHQAIHPAHPKFHPKTLLSSAKIKARIKKDKAILEGFERIREIIDLRVQIPDALEFSARSKDGIPIKILDARVVFSVSRGKRTPTIKEPYPYTDEAIYALVYKEPHLVTEEIVIHQRKFRSPRETELAAMKSLLRRELSDFMGRHELGEYLASIGKPETNAIEKIEHDISKVKQKLSGPNNQPTPPASPALSFTPRSQLSRLFIDFNGKFNQDQKRRGVEAQWVGVGTWKMPPGIPENTIPQKHLAAWRITLENIRRGSDQEFKELEKNAQADQLQRLIQQTPINIYRDGQNSGIPANRVRINLIMAYCEQFSEAIDILSTTGRPIPPSIVVAYFKLALKHSHLAYPEIPGPSSSREKRLYGELLKRVKIHQAIERLIALESRFIPDTNRADLLEKIINSWDADMK